MQLRSSAKPARGDVRLVLSLAGHPPASLEAARADAAAAAFGRDQEWILFPDAEPALAVRLADGEDTPARLEAARRLGAEACEALQRAGARAAWLSPEGGVSPERAKAFCEGLALAGYQFLKYRTGGEGRHALATLKAAPGALPKAELTELAGLVDALYATRDLVNEPLSFLTAPRFAEEIKRLGKEAGFRVSVLNKARIEKLGMGGLLAVNKGSVDPPTFSILEWKPPRARNRQPVVLVGKGVVYDTGGLSLKPTKNSMDFMKCDMAGGAAVVGAVYAAARNRLPVHVVGLVPASDNRPGGNAYAPGDVVTMYSGKTVEVLNTDAEGRMLLADALHYAKRYKPSLVIDLATLTGAAAAAIGPLGLVAMGTADEDTVRALRASGDAVHERLAVFPFWEEYGDEIKSDIADIKNVGGGFGGAITAGKFLEHFTDYPWMHLDIAGPSWLHAPSAYRTKGGTGTGVRLLYHFLKHHAS